MYVGAQVLHPVSDVVKTIKNAVSEYHFSTPTVAPLDAPVNDNCTGAITLTVNPDFSCAAVTNGTLVDATDSNVHFPNELGTANNDVWYKFTAASTTVKILLQNVEGQNSELVHEVFSGDCSGTFTSLFIGDYEESRVEGLTVGTTYYLRVYSQDPEQASTATFTICIGTPPPPPVNDNCSGAIALTVNTDNTCTTQLGGTVTSATNSGVDPGEGNGQADDDVWYTFVATATSQMITLSNIEGNSTDLVHQVLQGSCNGGLSVIKTSDNDISVTTGLVIGQTYFIRVYSFFEIPAETTFDICVGIPPAAPVNDDCAQATVLTSNADFECAAVSSGTLYFATDSGIPSDMGSPDEDVWYTFEATAEIHSISLLNKQGSQTDLLVEAFEGFCDGALTSIQLESDGVLLHNLTIGQTYYVRVFSWSMTDFEPTTFDICLGTPPPPPDNDECDAAVVLTVNPAGSCADIVHGTIAGAFHSGVDEPIGTANDDVWYTFEATATRHKFTLLDVSGSTTDLVMQVMSGDCGQLANVAYREDDEMIVNDLVIGTTYYFRVYSFTEIYGQSTKFDICLSVPPPPPSNDNCDQAIALTVNPEGSCAVVSHGTVDQATNSNVPVPAGNFSSPDDDVWYNFVATAANHSISLTNIEGSDYYLNMNVLEGGCDELASIAITDNQNINLTGLTVGNTYYVRVYSYFTDPQDTTFDICINVTPPPPANDDCSGATVLLLDTNYCNGTNTNGNTTSATDSLLETPSCFSEANNDVWYSFTVPANVATVKISTDFLGGTLYDTQVALYSGVCGQLTEIGCDQDSGEVELENGNSYNSIIADAEVTVGETYFVRVSNYSSGTDGSFCLEVTTASTLSIDDYDQSALKAYPNPVKGFLTLTNTKNITNVEVYNLLGQKFITKALNTNESQIDMSHLSAGTYMVKVTADNAVKTIKVIKE